LLSNINQPTPENLQKRYEGFLRTPCLWESDDVYDLFQFEIQQEFTTVDIKINEKTLLGKYIERLVSYQLNQEVNISILCENIQIQNEKITLGELDFVLKRDQKTIHLEVIYKFYLYDENVGNTQIDHFVGPNREDSLKEKLTKLKDKQLPLLYSTQCIKYLNSINLNITDIEQQVYFKAQLFVPLSNKSLQLIELNSDCIIGFYMNKKELLGFSDCKFFIPNKKDWILKPHIHVNWLNFKNYIEVSNTFLKKKISSLAWMKKPNGELEKFFLVWWE
jgi:hypothetical protein